MNVFVSTAILGLAWFAALNAAASLVSWGAACLISDRIVPSVGRSRLLLTVRFLPSVVATLVCFALFVPAHLRLEPAGADERIGLVPLALAAAALFLAGRSLCRIGRLLLASERLRASIGAQRGSGTPDRHWIELPLLPGIALAGVLRPRLLIGTDARKALTDAELEVAIDHELAHHRALDNLTRSLIACLPDFFGCTSAAGRIEGLWNSQAECLADARAANGSRERATRLASALIKVARLHTRAIQCPAMWSMFHQAALLEMRVRLLVEHRPPRIRARRCGAVLATLVGSAVALAWAVGLPDALHGLTEVLIVRLP